MKNLHLLIFLITFFQIKGYDETVQDITNFNPIDAIFIQDVYLSKKLAVATNVMSKIYLWGLLNETGTKIGEPKLLLQSTEKRFKQIACSSEVIYLLEENGELNYYLLKGVIENNTKISTFVSVKDTRFSSFVLKDELNAVAGLTKNGNLHLIFSSDISIVLPKQQNLKFYRTVFGRNSLYGAGKNENGNFLYRWEFLENSIQNVLIFQLDIDYSLNFGKIFSDDKIILCFSTKKEKKDFSKLVKKKIFKKAEKEEKENEEKFCISKQRNFNKTQNIQEKFTVNENLFEKEKFEMNYFEINNLLKESNKEKKEKKKLLVLDTKKGYEKIENNLDNSNKLQQNFKKTEKNYENLQKFQLENSKNLLNEFEKSKNSEKIQNYSFKSNSMEKLNYSEKIEGMIEKFKGFFILQSVLDKKHFALKNKSFLCIKEDLENVVKYREALNKIFHILHIKILKNPFEDLKKLRNVKKIESFINIFQQYTKKNDYYLTFSSFFQIKIVSIFYYSKFQIFFYKMNSILKNQDHLTLYRKKFLKHLIKIRKNVQKKYKNLNFKLHITKKLFQICNRLFQKNLLESLYKIHRISYKNYIKMCKDFINENISKTEEKRHYFNKYNINSRSPSFSEFRVKQKDKISPSFSNTKKKNKKKIELSSPSILKPKQKYAKTSNKSFSSICSRFDKIHKIIKKGDLLLKGSSSKEQSLSKSSKSCAKSLSKSLSKSRSKSKSFTKSPKKIKSKRSPSCLKNQKISKSAFSKSDEKKKKKSTTNKKEVKKVLTTSKLKLKKH